MLAAQDWPPLASLCCPSPGTCWLPAQSKDKGLQPSPGFHLPASGGRPAGSSPESDPLTPPRSQPTSEQEILPLPKEWETAGEERDETEGKAEEEGEGEAAKGKRRSIKRSQIWLKPQGKTFYNHIIYNSTAMCIRASYIVDPQKPTIEIMHLLD